jgi:hypothetical protein
VTAAILQESARRFYLGFLLPLVICFMALKGSELLLVRSGEYLDLDTVVERLGTTHGVYGTALSDRTWDFKQRLYRHIRPKVVAVGSSRVMQFRQEDFSVPFVNLGGGDLDVITAETENLFRDQKPDLIIMGVDFWWFHGDGGGLPAVPAATSAGERHVSMADRFMPVTWMFSGKLGFSSILRILSGSSPDIGVTGVVRGDGYAADGSYRNAAEVQGKFPSDDYRFSATQKKIAAGTKNYATAGGFSDDQWKRFSGLLDFYRAQGIPTVLFLPPMSQTALDMMAKSGNYAYVDQVRLRLPALAAQYGMRFFDDHEPKPLGATDCEFFDAHHGGPVVYKRILLDMANNVPEVESIAAVPALKQDIARFAGHASTLAEGEVDFLGIGCKK